MPSQRIILGIGLAILLVIGAASIGLDLKSRADNEEDREAYSKDDTLRRH